jgi:hypothetical protein
MYTVRIKYKEVNVIKKAKKKSLYIENYKTLMKEIKENMNKCKDIQQPCTRRECCLNDDTTQSDL